MAASAVAPSVLPSTILGSGQTIGQPDRSLLLSEQNLSVSGASSHTDVAPSIAPSIAYKLSSASHIAPDLANVVRLTKSGKPKRAASLKQRAHLDRIRQRRTERIKAARDEKAKLAKEAKKRELEETVRSIMASTNITKMEEEEPTPAAPTAPTASTPSEPTVLELDPESETPPLRAPSSDSPRYRNQHPQWGVPPSAAYVYPPWFAPPPPPADYRSRRGRGRRRGRRRARRRPTLRREPTYSDDLDEDDDLSSVDMDLIASESDDYDTKSPRRIRGKKRGRTPLPDPAPETTSPAPVPRTPAEILKRQLYGR